jgi:hypothetical protein
VENIGEAGYTANRSSLMRHIMKQLLEKLEKQNDSLPKEREIRHSNFYFEKGTKVVSNNWGAVQLRNPRFFEHDRRIFSAENYRDPYYVALVINYKSEKKR